MIITLTAWCLAAAAIAAVACPVLRISGRSPGVRR